MEMNNATAAGPSYGIFDVLFGKVPKEDAAVEGNEQGPFSQLLKILGDKNSELADQQSRTDKETSSGRVGEEYLSSMMLGMMPTANSGTMSPSPDMSNALSGQSIGVAPSVTSNLTSDPALSAQHLLSAIKAKSSAEANEEQDLAGALQNAGASDPKLKALVSGMVLGGALVEEHMSKEISQLAPNLSKLLKASEEKGPLAKAINAKDVEILEIEGAEPSLHSTHDFLQLRNMAKPELPVSPEAQALNPSELRSIKAKQNMAVKGQGDSVDLLLQKNSGNKINSVSNELETGGKSGFSNNEFSSLPNPGAPSDFGLKLGGAIAGGVLAKDVFLDASNRENIRAGIMPEITQSVSSQSLRGGGEMKLIMHPEELGEIKLKIGTKNGRVEVSVETENKQVADIIRGGSQELEQALGSHKLELSKFEVSVSDKTASVVGDVRESFGSSNSGASAKDFSQGSAQRQSDFASNQRESRSDRQNRRFEGEEPVRSTQPRRASSVSRAYNNSGRLDVVA